MHPTTRELFSKRLLEVGNIHTTNRLGLNTGGAGNCWSRFALRSRSIMAVLAVAGLNDACSSDTLGTSSEHRSNMGSKGKLLNIKKIKSRCQD